MSESSVPNGPNPAMIFETLNAYQRTGALRAAIELRMFSVIHDRPKNAGEIARECNASVRGIRILCDYLTVLGFLAKSEQDYSLTPTSALFLDEASPQYMGAMARFVASDEMIRIFGGVTGAVRKGGTLLPDGGSTKLDYEPWIEFAESMAPLMMPSALFIASLVSERFGQRPIRVFDIAASHGQFGLSIVRQNPASTIVAQDFAPVLTVTRRNVEQAGLLDRYEFLPGDVMTIDYPGSFDCILLTNFLHHFSQSVCEALLRRLKERLNPGGMIVTLEFVPNENRISPPIPATFALTMLMTTGEGDAYTFAEYRRLFENAGFHSNQLLDVPQSPSRIIVSSV
ncbi:MAG: class I SAM-dependent methyltransferase [Planctomycetaceae bacterium]